MHEMEENQEDGIILKNSPSQLKLSCCENFIFYLDNMLWGICSLGLVFLCGFYTVNQMSATIISTFGKILHVEFEPGLRWYTIIRTNKQIVDLRVKDMNIKGSSCPDSHGSPLSVSCIVTYSVSDPVKSVYHVKDP